MPIPWGSIAAAIPWSEVINRAPDVLKSARKAWQKIGHKSPIPAPPPDSALPERIATLEGRCLDLETRLQDSTQVLEQLAEQQTGLIAEVARLQRRTWWLTMAVLVLIAALAVTLVWSAPR
ncbi:MAG: hypothetical protein JNJ44_11570 [Zoogloeaceae bacterium]|nr:hypothetical protein [Zoogloeaceae bacterium]